MSRQTWIALILLMLIAIPSSVSAQTTTAETLEQALGLPPSRESGLEIRIWMRSISRVNEFYRLVKSDTGVSAERYAITEVIHADKFTNLKEARHETDTNRRLLAKERCSGKIIETADVMWCRVTTSRSLWSVTFDDLLPDELWKLPPQEQTTCSENGVNLAVLDGVSVDIELIEAGRRHRVEYSNPDVCCKTIACAIVDHVRTVVRNIY